MKRALLTMMIISGVFFVVVNVYAGDDTRAVFFAALGILAGMAALVPLVEWIRKEDAIRSEREGAVAWIDREPFGFSQRLADIYADAFADFDGDKLVDAMHGADHLATALIELVRLAKIRRQEELLRSRTWLP